MFRFRHCLLGALFALGGAALGHGAALALPPIAGEISGDLSPLALKDAPALHWKLTLQSPGPGERVARFAADGAESQLRAEARLDAQGDGVWRITAGHLALKSWLAGLLMAGEADITGKGTVKDGVLDGNVTLTLTGIDLGELLRFADAEQKIFRSAEGRVEGTVVLRVRAGEILPGDAVLHLMVGTVALISLQPSPGLLTAYVPEQVRKLYPGIAAIEMGQTPLEARVLRLTYHPDKDAAGRSAQVRIEGRPRDPKLIAPLELDLNLTGPVESLVRKMLDSRLQLGPAK